MEIIYILSTEENRAKNIYKPGKYTGTIHKLEEKYVESLINPIIYFFYPTKYASLIKIEIKKQLNDRRIINDNGIKTDWVYSDLKSITDIVFETDSLLHKLAVINPNNIKFIGKVDDTINNESVGDFNEEYTSADIIISTLRNYYEITNDYKDKVSISSLKKFKRSCVDRYDEISSHEFDEILREKLKLKCDRDKNTNTGFWRGIKEI